MPLPISPVQVLSPPGGFNDEFPTGLFGPFEYNGVLFCVGGNRVFGFDCPTVPDAFNVIRSGDCGATWTIADPLGSGLWCAGANNWIAADTYDFENDTNARIFFSSCSFGQYIYLAWWSMPPAPTGGLTRIQLSRFDMASELWDVDIVASGTGPDGITVSGVPADNRPTKWNMVLRVLPNGNPILFYCPSQNAGGWTVLAYNIFDVVTGAWGGPVTIQDDASNNHYPLMAVVGDFVHLWSASDQETGVPPPPSATMHHVGFNASTLVQGVYQTLTTDLNLISHLYSTGIPAAGVVDGVQSVVLPRLQNSQSLPGQSVSSIFIGADILDPVWTEEIFPFPDPTPDSYYIDFESGPLTLYSCVYIDGGAVNILIGTETDDGAGTILVTKLWRVLRAAAGVSFSNTLLHSIAGGQFRIVDPSAFVLTGSCPGVGIFFDTYDEPPGYIETAYFFGLEAAPPPPEPTIQPPPPGPSRVPVIPPPTWFDCCLWYEYLLWSGIEIPRPCPPAMCVCPSDPRLLIPLTGQEFFKQSGIALPAEGSGDVAVLQFRVPTGYDGIIYGVLHKFTGVGFVPGSGTLVWRLQLQNRYAKNYGNVQIELGDFAAYFPIENYIPIRSNQLITYYVNRAAGSGGLDPVGRVITGIRGWFYPLTLVPAAAKLKGGPL